MFRKLTALVFTLALVPALAFAQQTTTPTTDTSMRKDTASKITQDTSYGRLGAPMGAAHNPGLTSSQVKELQQAINSNGCDAGTADGVWSSKTESGVQCVRQQKNIQGNDLNDVLKALNLTFTVKKGSDRMSHDSTSR